MLFKDITGQQGADLGKKIHTIVSDRNANVEFAKTLSGVAQQATSDLNQGIDSSIEFVICKNGVIDISKSDASVNIKKREGCG